MRAMILAVSCGALAACGGGGGSGSATAAQVQTFGAAAQAISTAASSYGTAAQAMTDHADCTSVESAYEGQVRPPLSDMTGLAGAMDHGMASMGLPADADMTCGADAMAAELDHHASMACASTEDMAPNRAEASQHADAMSAWAEHQQVRSEQMGSMMGMSGMTGGSTTGTCLRNADGSFTLSGGGGMINERNFIPSPARGRTLMTRALISALALVGASACMHAGHAVSAAATPAAMQNGSATGGQMAGMCPTSVPGTQLAAEDTPNGEALTFTTTPDQAAALRERVHAMADMHNRHHASGEAGHGGMHGMMGGGSGGMSGMEMPPPSQATVEDLPDGARIVVTPNDPADLQRLQGAVRQHATQMQQQGCGMMMNHAGHGS